MKTINTFFFLIISFSSLAQLVVVDSTTVDWELLPHTPFGIYQEFYQHGDTLFAVAEYEGYLEDFKKVLLSTDDGETWSNFMSDSIVQFVANDHHYFYTTDHRYGLQKLVSVDKFGNYSVLEEAPEPTLYTGNREAPILYLTTEFLDLKIFEDSIFAYTVFESFRAPGRGSSTYFYAERWKYTRLLNTPSLEYLAYLPDVFSSDTYLSNGHINAIQDSNLISSPFRIIDSVGLGTRHLVKKDGCFHLFKQQNDHALIKYETCDLGITWATDTLSNSIGEIKQFYTFDNKTYLVSKSGLFSLKENLLELDLLYENGADTLHIYQISIIDDVIYAPTNELTDILISPDLGQNWNIKKLGTKEIDDSALTSHGTDSLFAFLGDENWYKWNEQTKIWERGENYFPAARDVIRLGDTLVASHYDFLSISFDNGETWKKITEPNGTSGELSKGKNRIFWQSPSRRSKYYSKDKGVTWNIFDIEFRNFAVHLDTVIGIDYDGALYRSVDEGDTWETFLTNEENFWSVFRFKNKWMTKRSNQFGTLELLHSSSDGEQWNQVTNGFYGDYLVIDSILFFNRNNHNIHASLDGEQWTVINSPKKSFIQLYHDSNFLHEENIHFGLYRTSYLDLKEKLKFIMSFSRDTIDVDWCSGDTLVGIPLVMDTLLTDTIYSSAGADSILFTNLTILPHLDTTVTISLEPGMLFNSIPIFSDTTIIEVFVGSNGCDSTVLNEISILSSSKDLSDEFALKIAPNPSKDYFYLNFDLTQKAELESFVVNIDGKRVKTIFEQRTYLPQKFDLKVTTESLNPGAYFLIIRSEKEQLTKKLIIE